MQLCPDIRFRIHNFASRHIRKVSLFPMFCNLISSWYLYISRRSPSINLRISYGHGLDIKVGSITTCLPCKVWNRNEPTRWLPTHHLAEPFDSAHLWTRLRTCACHLSSRPLWLWLLTWLDHFTRRVINFFLNYRHAESDGVLSWFVMSFSNCNKTISQIKTETMYL
jgi:hypothetical protein